MKSIETMNYMTFAGRLRSRDTWIPAFAGMTAAVAGMTGGGGGNDGAEIAATAKVGETPASVRTRRSQEPRERP